MKTLSILILAFILIPTISFSQRKKKNEIIEPLYLLERQFKGFIPVPPLDYDADVPIVDSTGTWKYFPIGQLSLNKKSILRFLPNEAVTVTVSKVDRGGEIKYASSGISGETGSYIVTLDYAKFTTLKVIPLNFDTTQRATASTCKGFAKVGVGLRITANIETRKAGLNVGSLFGLGISAESDELSGTMSVDVVGMESGEITNLLPLPSEISTTSIQTSLQAVAAIKAQLYANNTRLYPQVLAVKSTTGCTVMDIVTATEEIINKQHQQQQQQQKKK